MHRLINVRSVTVRSLLVLGEVLSQSLQPRGPVRTVGVCLVAARELEMIDNKTINVSVSHIDGLVQDCSISTALAMEIMQSCTKPSI